MAAYALVRESLDPLRLPPPHRPPSAGGPRHRNEHHHDDDDNVDDAANVYGPFARRYPRDQRSPVGGEGARGDGMTVERGGGGGRSSWWWPFGGRSPSSSSSQRPSSSRDQTVSEGGGEHGDGDSDSDSDEDEMEGEGAAFASSARMNDGMCGATGGGVDPSSVPFEATMAHRFHAASIHNGLSLGDDVRAAWAVAARRPPGLDGWAGGSDEESTGVVVAGLGIVAEFPLPFSSSASDGGGTTHGDQQRPRLPASINSTSDREAVLHCRDKIPAGSASPLYHHPSYVRAAHIGPHCLAVSWGFEDGLVVLYRRVLRDRQTRGRNSDDDLEVGWESVAVISPGEAILRDAAGAVTPLPALDNDRQQQPHRQHPGATGLLRVSDLIPLVVCPPAADHQEDEETVAPTAILAVARLGGYLELAPLPLDVWDVSPLPPSSASRKGRGSRRTNKKKGQHYAEGLPDLSLRPGGGGAVALSTKAHHVDVTSIDVYRTTVGGNAVWDANRHPDDPPAEFVLAAAGRGVSQQKREEGEEGTQPPRQRKFFAEVDDTARPVGGAVATEEEGECVTMWSVTTVYVHPEETHLQHQQQQPMEEEFRVHVGYLGSLPKYDVGPPTTAFVSPSSYAGSEILKRWRSVPEPAYGTRAAKRLKLGPPHLSVSVLTAPMPVSSLRFVPSPQVRSVDSTTTVLLGVLDGNGGVSVLNCTKLVRRAIHSDLDDRAVDVNGGMEMPRRGNGTHGGGGELIVLHGRRELAVDLRSKTKTERAVAVGWWNAPVPTLAPSPAIETSTTMQTLLLATIGGNGTIRLRRLQPCKGRGRVRDVLRANVSTAKGSIQNAAVILFPYSPLHPAAPLPFLLRDSSSSVAPGATAKATAVAALSLGAVKLVRPSSLAASLAQKGEHRRAIEVARRFGWRADDGSGNDGGRRILDECHRRLWEDERDAEALLRVSDDAFIVQEALALCGDGSVSSKVTLQGLGYLELDDIRAIYKEALRRVRQMEDDRIEFEGSTNDKAEAQLRSSLVRLGTYHLLCGRIRAMASSKPCPSSGRSFLCRFVQASLSDLAASVARRGDLGGLTLLVVRHSDELGNARSRMDLLDALPHSMEVRSYRHLLPCWGGGRDDDTAGGGGVWFSLSNEERDPSQQGATENPASSPPLLNAAQLVSRLRNNYIDLGGVNLFSDEDDEAEVLASVEGVLSPGAEKGVSRDDIAAWYVHRARSLHETTGLLLPVEELCSMGLERLGEKLINRSRILECSGSAVRELRSFQSASHNLNRLVLDEVVPSPVLGETSIMTIPEFMSLNVADTVPLMLGDAADAATVFARYEQYVRPLTDGGGACCMAGWGHEGIVGEHLNGNVRCRDEDRIIGEDGVLQESTRAEVEEAIVSYCLGKVERAAPEALAICSVFSNASRTTIQKHRRVIREEARLICFILGAIYNSEVTLDHSDSLGKLWDLYECLPMRLPELEAKDSSLASLQSVVDRLPVHLLVLEMCSKWCIDRCAPPVTLKHLHIAERGIVSTAGFVVRIGGTGRIEGENDQAFSSDLMPNQKYSALGNEILAALTDGFCSRITDAAFSDQQRDQAVLDFILDVTEMNERCFRSELQLRSILEHHLARKLLYQRSFDVLRDIFKAKADWFDEQSSKRMILAFVREALTPRESSQDFGGGSRHSLIQAAIRCQDTLGPVFPGLYDEFDLSRRYLDAAHFIQNVLCCSMPNNASLDAVNFHPPPPVETIESVLKENPSNIILGCEEWADTEYAVKANLDISLYFASKDRRDVLDDADGVAVKELPPMPGGHILQLAGILGASSWGDQLLARCMMVDHAVGASLHGAASAICLSILHDDSTLRSIKSATGDLGREVSFLLRSIARVVSSESYSDYRVRKDICISTLHLFLGTTLEADNHDFDIILRYFPVLECQTSAMALARTTMLDMEDAPNEKHGINLRSVDGAIQDKEHGPLTSSRDAEASDFLVFKAAGFVSKQAKNIVGQVTKVAEPHHSGRFSSQQLLPMGVPSFPDNGFNLLAVYREVLESSSTDLHQLFSSLQVNLFREMDDDASTPLYIKSNESILRVASREVLLWCVAESVKMRGRKSRGTTLSSCRERLSKMLCFGTTLLLEIQDIASAQLVVSDVQNTLETEAAITVERLAEETQPSHVVPDETIVCQLCGRGYGINGSRRSAIMTNNESFSAALAWAITHFQDGDFDAPLVFVGSKHRTIGDNSQEQRFVDQNSIQMVRQVLQLVQQHLDRENAAGLINTVYKESIGCSEGTINTPEGTKPLPYLHLNAAREIDEPKTVEIDQPPPDSVSVLKPRTIEKGNKISTDEPPSTAVCKSGVVKPFPGGGKVVNTSAIKDGFSPPVREADSQTSTNPQRDSRKLLQGRSIASSHVTTSRLRHEPTARSIVSSNGSMGSRAALRERGKLVRNGANLEPMKLDAAERRRLAMEGRRILEEARKKSKTGENKVTAAKKPMRMAVGKLHADRVGDHNRNGKMESSSDNGRVLHGKNAAKIDTIKIAQHAQAQQHQTDDITDGCDFVHDAVQSNGKAQVNEADARSFKGPEVEPEDDIDGWDFDDF